MAIQGGPRVVTRGLIAYLDARSPKCFVSGLPTVVDLSANGNDFTVQGTPSWTYTGGWSSFSATSTGSRLASVTGWPQNLKQNQGGAGWSMCALAMGSGGTYGKIMGNWDSDDYIDMYKTNGQGWAQDYGFATTFVGPNSGANNSFAIGNDLQWRFLSATSTGGTLSNQNGTRNPTGALAIGNEPVGGPLSSNAWPYPGNIQMVMLYSGMLTLAEVRQNWDSFRARIGQ